MQLVLGAVEHHISQLGSSGNLFPRDELELLGDIVGSSKTLPANRVWFGHSYKFQLIRVSQGVRPISISTPETGTK
jgi:hypothetical protein